MLCWRGGCHSVKATWAGWCIGLAGMLNIAAVLFFLFVPLSRPRSLHALLTPVSNSISLSFHAHTHLPSLSFASLFYLLSVC